MTHSESSSKHQRASERPKLKNICEQIQNQIVRTKELNDVEVLPNQSSTLRQKLDPSDMSFNKRESNYGELTV